MFIWQRFKYETLFITTVEQCEEMLNKYLEDTQNVTAYDTESTGLNIIKDVPFLIGFGFGNYIYAVESTPQNQEVYEAFVNTMYLIMSLADRSFAHNAKFDWHMMYNLTKEEIPSNINLADSQTVVRLTSYTDDMLSKSLESVGAKYVHPNAKEAGKAIKLEIKRINGERKKVVMEEYKEKGMAKSTGVAFGKLWEAYKHGSTRVKYIRHEWEDLFEWIDERYTEANYYDVYLEKPNLLIYYLFDDVAIVLEYLKKALPALIQVDRDLKTFNRECKLISIVGRMERVGFKLDIDYLIGCYYLMQGYQQDVYQQLWDLTGIQGLSVGQHKVIMDLFRNKYQVVLTKADNGTLKKVQNGDAGLVSDIIRKLRTVDKWLSTYVIGLLNQSIDGRLHPSVDNAGAVSGRVSSNFQQMPRDALFSNITKSDKKGAFELYNPRKAIIADDDYLLVFFDYSQQELRVQAYYTLLYGLGDRNLCRAYMPFECYTLDSENNKRLFNFKNPDDIQNFGDYEWYQMEDDKPWEPTDVHSATTFQAFPEVEQYASYDEESPEYAKFYQMRSYGKIANFLKNYGGGKGALIAQLDIDEETADKLDKAYYRAFPGILDYQKGTQAEASQFGFTDNLYGRRYYMQDSSYFYKLANYRVQGSSADMIKDVEVRTAHLTEGTKSSFVMPIHDEVAFRIHKSELHLIDEIDEIMKEIKEVPWVPMKVGIEWSNTSWADVHPYRGLERLGEDLK